MRPLVRLLLLVLAFGAPGAGVAHAAVTAQPALGLPAFARGEREVAPGVPLVTLRWAPATFSPTSADDQLDVGWGPLGNGGGGFIAFSGAAASSTTSQGLGIHDGVQLLFTLAACVTPSTSHCPFPSLVSGTTRLDATAPSGSVRVNGGAPATNSRDVTLDLTASDPLINGIPGSASGLSQVAVNVDGDGTYPCPTILDPGADSSGCAVGYSVSVPATLSPGDGIKTVAVTFGDGARLISAPCVPTMHVFCTIDPFGGSPILGNASTPASDTIILDTVAPIAVATQDRFTVERGGAVSFDAGASVDPGTATPSGIDPPAATWDFGDGSAPIVGPTASHVFNTTGTFVGRLRVRDRAGNISDPRPFSVTVLPRPGEATAGSGSIASVRGSAAFSISRVRVTARYLRSRLRGAITVNGSSTAAGGLRIALRRTARGPLLASRATTVAAGPFSTSLRLPARLPPGVYGLAFVGPGGILTSALTLTAPNEGVISGGRLTTSGGVAVAAFTFAAQPARSLRARLTVSWTQGARALGSVSVRSGSVVHAHLPAGVHLGRGRLRAVLRAGSRVVGSAAADVR